MRGNGRVYQRGRIWWIAYYDNGTARVVPLARAQGRCQAVEAAPRGSGDGCGSCASATADQNPGCHDARPVRPSVLILKFE